MLTKKSACIYHPWFNSEGAPPSEVVDRLRAMGFEPMKGYYDHVYDWRKRVNVEDIIQLSGAVHETLKGLKVLYKLETV